MSADKSKRYDRDYYFSTYGEAALKRFGMHWWSVRLYAGISNRWLRRIGGKRVLDVGCGHGFFLSFLDDRYETFGIDVSEYAIEQCNRFTPTSRCGVADVEAELPGWLEPGSFDLVNAKYVFEHLHEPGAAIVRLAGLLRVGGILVFSVPNTESIGARWKGRDWYADPSHDPTHCSLLAPDEWLGLTRAAALKVLRESADGYWDLPYVRWLPKCCNSRGSSRRRRWRV